MTRRGRAFCATQRAIWVATMRRLAAPPPRLWGSVPKILVRLLSEARPKLLTDLTLQASRWRPAALLDSSHVHESHGQRPLDVLVRGECELGFRFVVRPSHPEVAQVLLEMVWTLRRRYDVVPSRFQRPPHLWA